MKTARLALSLFACLLVGCSTTPKAVVTQNAVRSYNGTASVGDFLTISVDSSALTITYKNFTNGETGTVPYTVNSDGTYTITDPNGNLLSAYEVPGTMLMVEAANAGPNKDAIALITAIETAPVSIGNLAGENFNYLQVRTSSGGMELGNISVDASGDITHYGYWPYGADNQQNAFSGASFPASSVVEDPSGNFFVINESSGPDYVFGTAAGFFAVDTGNGTVLGLPKAASKSFVTSNAGSYTAIYYEKQNAQMMQGNTESGTPLEGKGTVTVGSDGSVTITDSQSNTLASGTLVAVADTAYLYNGTQSELSDPLYGMFTFRTTTGNSQQDVFVTFQGNAVIFSSLETGLPLQPNPTYSYFYGVGLK
jgi:hypothetical protein